MAVLYTVTNREAGIMAEVIDAPESHDAEFYVRVTDIDASQSLPTMKGFIGREGAEAYADRSTGMQGNVTKGVF